jgi:hypothetical protein
MRSALALVLAAAPLVGCAPDDDAIRADVQLLAIQGAEPSAAALDRVARFGRRALPSIEQALHTADPPGRKNLILALRRIGDADAVPLLGHLARYDAAPDVRREAAWTLRSWSTGKDARGDRARAELRTLDEAEEREEAG